jgi:hypothetical protein
MLVQCENCGAPLDVKDAFTTHVTCAYCGASNKVRSLKTIAATTPQGWVPPQQWSPPQIGTSPAQVPTFKAARVAAVGAAGVTAATGCANAAIGIVIAVVVVVAVIGGVVASSPGLVSRIPFMGWDGRQPFHCGVNDTVRIDGVTANLPGQTAIVVEQNCDVEIVNSHITALEGIRADGNRRVVVRNSTIVASGTGITAGGNKEVLLENSTIDAGGVGVAAGGNVRVTVTGGRVAGAMMATTTSANATVNVNGGQMINGVAAPLPYGTTP